MNWCKCGCVAVDGGTGYLKRLTGTPSSGFIERSEWEEYLFHSLIINLFRSKSAAL